MNVSRRQFFQLLGAGAAATIVPLPAFTATDVMLAPKRAALPLSTTEGLKPRGTEFYVRQRSFEVMAHSQPRVHLELWSVERRPSLRVDLDMWANDNFPGIYCDDRLWLDVERTYRNFMELKQRGRTDRAYDAVDLRSGDGQPLTGIFDFRISAEREVEYVNFGDHVRAFPR